MRISDKKNVVLIGMAAAGKSTVGEPLAALLGFEFVDVDTLIEKDQGVPLQEALENLGLEGFRAVEERILLSMDYHQYVIATGGSAIYSESGIRHLKQSSVLVFLDVSLPILKQRVGDYSARGLVKKHAQSFDQLFAERAPLYKKHADLRVVCGERSVTEICDVIKSWLDSKQ